MGEDGRYCSRLRAPADLSTARLTKTRCFPRAFPIAYPTSHGHYEPTPPGKLSKLPRGVRLDRGCGRLRGGGARSPAGCSPAAEMLAPTRPVLTSFCNAGWRKSRRRSGCSTGSRDLPGTGMLSLGGVPLGRRAGCGRLRGSRFARQPDSASIARRAAPDHRQLRRVTGFSGSTGVWIALPRRAAMARERRVLASGCPYEFGSREYPAARARRSQLHPDRKTHRPLLPGRRQAGRRPVAQGPLSVVAIADHAVLLRPDQSSARRVTLGYFCMRVGPLRYMRGDIQLA